MSTANHVIAIGAAGDDVNNSCFIGNIRRVTTAHNDAVPVLIDSNGQSVELRERKYTPEGYTDWMVLSKSLTRSASTSKQALPSTPH